MTFADPFAPATSPRHPSQIRRARTVTDPTSGSDELAFEEYHELFAEHATAAEREQAAEVSREQLDLRAEATADFLERRRTDPDATPPTIVDATGAPHVLHVSDDGTDGAWCPASADETPSGHDSPQESAGEDDLDDALAALDALKKK